ncbi:MAG TPA: glycosyltransferase [Acidimicrobiales bacterium]|jgi:hypothetical protein|nr:glycosyltransferase [Acidimicrobiales bacterium]
MALSVVLMTKDSGGHLGWWLERVRRYADEIVVGVDRSSADDTYDLARAGADRVHILELAGIVEPAKDWLAKQARGDWVLMLDDDEALPADAHEQLPGLLDDRRYTHYGLPVRWVVPAAGGGLAWLAQHPWHSPRWVRLARNLGGLLRVEPLMHAVPEVAGEGANLRPDGTMALYHLDLLWRDRPAREAKMARYRIAAGMTRPTGEEHYLYEDYASTLVEVAIPPDEGLLARPGKGRVGDGVPRHLPVITLAALGDHAADISDDPPIWSVEWLGHETPARLLTNRGYAVRVRVRNTSRATWRSPGTVAGRVALCHRWDAGVWGSELPLGDVTLLDHAVAPGDEAELLAGLWTPARPGRYTLTWDMLCERVAWFSARGAAPLRVEVDVVDEGPRPRAPHFAGVAPGVATDDAAARPGPTAPGRMVALPPIRVLDTRDGSGLADAPKGPVAADDVVVLHIAGAAGVPHHATAVVATVSVVDADYGGFLTAYPTDGTRGQAFPHLYFGADRPTSATVVTALGRGHGHGRLSLHLSSGPPRGGAQMLVDISGYLVPD